MNEIFDIFKRTLALVVLRLEHKHVCVIDSLVAVGDHSTSLVVLATSVYASDHHTDSGQHIGTTSR